MHKSTLLRTCSIVISAVMATTFCSTVSAFSKEDFVPRLTEPEKKPEAPEYVYYYSEENVFNKMNYGMPNCTAYAWGRAYEIMGEKPVLSTGNAGRWYSYNMNNAPYAYGCQPRLGAVACWDKWDLVNGHVAVVEVVSDDKSMITVSESQWGAVNFITYDYKGDSSDHMSKYRFLGYIYLDEKTGKNYGDAFKIIADSDKEILTYSENLSLELCKKLNNISIQDFRFEPTEDGYYKIWSFSDDVLLTNTDNTIGIVPEENAQNTEWKIYRESEDVYTICPKDNENLVLTADKENNLSLTPYVSGSSQLWNIEQITGFNELSVTYRFPELSLNTENAKKEYIADEILDISGVEFFINGNKIENPEISKIRPLYDFSKTGEQIVTIEYGELSADYTVNISEKKTENVLPLTTETIVAEEETVVEKESVIEEETVTTENTDIPDTENIVDIPEDTTTEEIAPPADIKINENVFRLEILNDIAHIIKSADETTVQYDYNNDNLLDIHDVLCLYAS